MTVGKNGKNALNHGGVDTRLKTRQFEDTPNASLKL